MAQRRRVLLECDVCNRTEDDSALVITRHIAIDRKEFEFEACDDCWSGRILAAFAVVGPLARKVTAKRAKAARPGAAYPGTDWRVTFHCLQRMGERKLDPTDVIEAADNPTQTWPGNPDESGEDAEVRVRGTIKALVDPVTRTIITAADTSAGGLNWG